MKILCVTAHADDFECHMGGLAFRLLGCGHRIFSIVTTAGKRSQEIEGRGPAICVRTYESIKAHAHAGIVPTCLARYELDFGDTLETRHEMQDFFDAIAPDMVITHWPVDVNPDHRVCATLAMGPVLQKGVNVELFFFEPCSSGRSSAAVRPQAIAFHPTHYVDVSNDELLVFKRAMLDEHVSQDPEGMWQGQLGLQRNRGREAGVTMAEAYVRATRYGGLHPDLREIFISTPFILPRPIGVDFSPEAIGVTV